MCLSFVLYQKKISLNYLITVRKRRREKLTQNFESDPNNTVDRHFVEGTTKLPRQHLDRQKDSKMHF